MRVALLALAVWGVSAPAGVPGCPHAALPVTHADFPAAERAVLSWLPAHYKGATKERARSARRDARSARVVAIELATSPLSRGGAARAACGSLVQQRTIEVDLVLTRVARYSTALSELSYFVSRTRRGWIVWQRVH